ncbi:MAG: SpoIIE family protein phosphatase [Acidimicrobiales bacterium]|nr:SpoIIE family protein phosphatase [Acidimicrobiales bacterium]
MDRDLRRPGSEEFPTRLLDALSSAVVDGLVLGVCADGTALFVSSGASAPDLLDDVDEWLEVSSRDVRRALTTLTEPGVSVPVSTTDQRRRWAAVEALRWVHEAIIAGEALDDTASGVVESACGVLGADAGLMVHPAPGDVADELTWTVHGFGDIPPPADPSLPEGRFRENHVSLVRDARTNSGFAALLSDAGLPPEQFVAALVAPIRDEAGDVIGHLLFGSREADYFSVHDAELAASIASTTGIAIDNAHRHEAERLAAMTFQRELLPNDPDDRDDLDLCVRYHPGRSGLDVGGDWYDVIEFGATRIGLAVGDVCGHGLTAAAHMGQLRFSFRALVQAAITPEEAFRVLNRLALTDQRTTVTIAYLELDTASGECWAWSCGHLPPLITGPDGARWATDAAAQGPMLGFLDHIDVPSSRTVLHPEETLLLYTDGLVERRGEGIDAGLDRLMGALGSTPGMLDDVCDLLYRDLAETGPDADDTALLAARRRPENLS